MKYSVSIKIDMGKRISAIGELVDDVNKNMSSFGIEEKMFIVSEIEAFTINTDRELTAEEKKTIKDVIEDKFKDMEGVTVGEVMKI